MLNRRGAVLYQITPVVVLRSTLQGYQALGTGAKLLGKGTQGLDRHPVSR